MKNTGGLKSTPNDISRTRPHEMQPKRPGARKGAVKGQKVPSPLTFGKK